MKSPFGIKILRHIINSSFNASEIELIVPETNSDDMFVNDVVVSTNQTDDEGIEYCRRALPNEPIRGIVVDFEPSHLYENYIYRRKNTRRKVRINENPFVYCKAMVNDVLLDGDIGKTLNIDSGTGNTITGISAVQLDYATIINDGAQFRIQKILERVDTVASDLVTPIKYSIVKCIINHHELLPYHVGTIDNFIDVLTVTVPGQTAFTLSQIPYKDSSVQVYLNGQWKGIRGVHFNQTGISFTC